MGQAGVDCAFHLAGVCGEVSGGAFGIGAEFCIATFSFGDLHGGFRVALPADSDGKSWGGVVRDHAVQCVGVLQFPERCGGARVEVVGGESELHHQGGLSGGDSSGFAGGEFVAAFLCEYFHSDGRHSGIASGVALDGVAVSGGGVSAGVDLAGCVLVVGGCWRVFPRCGGVCASADDGVAFC